MSNEIKPAQEELTTVHTDEEVLQGDDVKIVIGIIIEA